MATKRMPPKDPAARLDYVVKLDAEIGTDALLTVTFDVPAGITKDTDSFDGKSATIWLEGGTDGESYKIVCHYVTVSGRHDTRSFIVPVKSRA